jgi:hypothetical protein
LQVRVLGGMSGTHLQAVGPVELLGRAQLGLGLSDALGDR